MIILSAGALDLLAWIGLFHMTGDIVVSIGGVVALNWLNYSAIRNYNKNK